MPPVRTVWVVRNPTPGSTLDDVIWKQDLDGLGDYACGAGPGTWSREMHSIYTDETEATADAEARLAAVARGLTLVRRRDGRVVGVKVPVR